jgi:hypothetical protein
MPGLEVAVSVSDIVSSLSRVGKIIEHIASGRVDVGPDVAAAESQLLSTLQEGPQLVNIEYIAHIRRIGPRFSTGDGMLARLHEASA